MISTLKNIEDFKIKAIELGFEIPLRPSQHEIDIWDSSRASRRDSANYIQRDKASRYKEFRLFKIGDDGSHWVFVGVFDVVDKRPVSFELSNRNSTGYSGFNLQDQKEWLKSPGIARIIF